MTCCRVCNSKLVEFFSLGDMPLANALLTRSDLKKEKKFLLSVGVCSRCYLVQLIKTVDPKDLFSHYLYFSSITDTIVTHSKKTAVHLIKKLNLNRRSLVIELGSNDGVHLRFYKEKGIPVLGIDPAKNIAKRANAQKIPTIARFFNSKLAGQLVKEEKKADLIYGANVLAHIPTITDVADGVQILLKKNGSAVFESPYLSGLFENKFDTIYHEHVFYYSLLSLTKLFKTAHLEIYDIEFIAMQGGSLRIYAGHIGEHKIESSVKKLISRELKSKYNKIATYRKIEKNVSLLKKNLNKTLKNLKERDKKIAAYGVPAKGVTLLNYFDVSKYLSFIVDKSPAKQGRYVPGVHLPIYSPSKIYLEKPNYILILPWNISKEIVHDLKAYKKSGGKFIIPIPQISVK